MAFYLKLGLEHPEGLDMATDYSLYPSKLDILAARLKKNPDSRLFLQLAEEHGRQNRFDDCRGDILVENIYGFQLKAVGIFGPDRNSEYVVEKVLQRWCESLNYFLTGFGSV